MGGGGQAEAGLLGRWLAKKSKQNATTSQKVADKLARLSPKSLLTVFKKNAGLQPLPVGNGSMVSATVDDDIALRRLHPVVCPKYVLSLVKVIRRQLLLCCIECSCWCESSC